jgi:hypothetical protein
MIAWRPGYCENDGERHYCATAAKRSWGGDLEKDEVDNALGGLSLVWLYIYGTVITRMKLVVGAISLAQ